MSRSWAKSGTISHVRSGLSIPYRQIEKTNLCFSPMDNQSESRLDMNEEVVEEEGIVDQQAVQRETVSETAEFELTSVDLKTETRETEDEVPPLENGQEEVTIIEK